MNDLLKLFRSFQDADNYEQRKVALDKVNGLDVSTVYSSDMGYETALCDKNGAHPVERYESRELAVIGHSDWLKKAASIETVTELGYGELADPEEITLERISE